MIDKLIKMILVSCQQSHPDYSKPQVPARRKSWDPGYSQQICSNIPKALYHFKVHQTLFN